MTAARAAPPRGTLSSVLLRALGWNYATSLLLLLAQMAYTAVTARTVTPQAFGAYAIGLTIVQLSSHFGGATLGNAVMRVPRLHAAAASTSLTISLLFGAALSGVLVLTAQPLAALLRSPGLDSVLNVLALTPPATGTAAVCAGLLRRHDRFRTASLIGLASSLLGFVAGAQMAVDGFGVVALTTAQVVTAWTGLAMGLLCCSSWLTLSFSRTAARELIPFSVQVSGQNLVHYVIENLPLWSVTRATGPLSTGYFSRSLQLVSLPAFQLVTGMQKSLYPLYYRVDRQARLRTALTDVLVSANGVACAFFGLAAACAPPAAVLLLGPGWTRSVTLLPALCLAFAAQTVYGVAASAAEALSWMRAIWTSQALFVLTMIGGLVLVGADQLIRVCLVMAAAALVAHAITLLAAGRRGVPLDVVLKAYAVHASLGFALYAVPVLATHAIGVQGPLPTLAWRTLAAGLTLALTAPARAHVPAYRTLVRRLGTRAGPAHAAPPRGGRPFHDVRHSTSSAVSRSWSIGSDST